MNDQLQQLFRLAVAKYIADRELLRAIWSQTPRDPWANTVRRAMPPIAPCTEMALRARHAANQSSRR